MLENGSSGKGLTLAELGSMVTVRGGLAAGTACLLQLPQGDEMLGWGLGVWRRLWSEEGEGKKEEGESR